MYCAMSNPSSDVGAVRESAPEPVYLDNAATSYPKPAEVVAAVKACLDQSLTVQRSTHLAQFRGDEILRRCRVKLARFFNACHPEELVYTYSATDGLNIAINGVVKPGAHVLVSPLEHHSVMRPLHHLRERLGVTWTQLPGDAQGLVDPGSLKQFIKPETCAVIINWISNVSGSVQPVKQIGAAARELGLAYVVDAAQATGSHPVDVQAIGCDAMAQPAHKALFSLPGLGVLYVRREFDLAPWRIGGTGYRSDLVQQPEVRPMRFEAGTPNVPAIVGLDAALDWFAQTTVERIEQQCAARVAQLIEGLREIPRVSVIGPPPAVKRGFVVSFTLDDLSGAAVDPLLLSQVLAEQYAISTRSGLHCAPTAHHHFGTYERGGTVRFSVSWFTTEEQVAYALAAVRQAAAEVG